MKIQKVINATLEDERALIDVSFKEPKLICRGDYYHDKIDEFIEGYLFCLDYNKLDYERLKDVVIKPDDRETIYNDEAIEDNKLFELCEFYAED